MTDPEPQAFIPPGEDLSSGDQRLGEWVSLSKEQLRARWSSEVGQQIARALRANPFSRTALDSLVGRYYGHTDLRGAPLEGANLQDADLYRVDLFGAQLTNANLERADLRESWLSEADIRGARFDWAKLDNALVDSVHFDHKTRFIGVNLNAVNFTLAALLQDLALTQQRIANLEKTHPKTAWFLRVTSDYGRSFGRFFFWSAFVIVVFGLIYNAVPGALSKSGIVESMYFSVVTFVTLGYGDIVPTTHLAMAIVIAEVLIGYLMLGLLVAIISKRILGG